MFHSARSWARLARRDDLLDKSLNNIIKYFLCSEHFTDDCFVDPNERTKLRKTIRPVTVPLPSIFHCNIGQYIKNKSATAEQISDEFDYYLTNSDEINLPNVKIHETDGDVIRPPYDYIEADDNNLEQHRTDCNSINTTIAEITAFLTADEDRINSINLVAAAAAAASSQHQEEVSDLIEETSASISYEECLSRSNNNIQLNNDEIIVSMAGEDIVEEDEVNDAGDHLIHYDGTCRLCAEHFDATIELISIFGGHEENLADDINLLMPNMVCFTNLFLETFNDFHFIDKPKRWTSTADLLLMQ